MLGWVGERVRIEERQWETMMVMCDGYDGKRLEGCLSMTRLRNFFMAGLV